MSKGSTGEVSVIEFRSAIQELLHSRIQEAITITLEEELAEALGCGPYERNGSRRGYRHGTYRRQITMAQGPQDLEVPRGRLLREDGSTGEFPQHDPAAVSTAHRGSRRGDSRGVPGGCK